MGLRELGDPSLLDALAYLDVLAEQKPEKLERACVRRHGRLETEATFLSLAESQARRFRLAAPAALLPLSGGLLPLGASHKARDNRPMRPALVESRRTTKKEAGLGKGLQPRLASHGPYAWPRLERRPRRHAALIHTLVRARKSRARRVTRGGTFDR